MNLGTFFLRDTPYSLGQYFGRLILLGSIPWFDVTELRFNLDKGSLLSFGSLHLVGGIFGGLLRERCPQRPAPVSAEPPYRFGPASLVPRISLPKHRAKEVGRRPKPTRDLGKPPSYQTRLLHVGSLG